MEHPTFITESLAKGLASRFLSEAESHVRQIDRNIDSLNFSSTTKKGWLIKHRKLADFVSNASFKPYFLGTKSKPALAFVGLAPDQHSFKDWEERCLTGRVLIFQYGTNACPEPEPVPFVISHHALARLFMRCEFLKGIADSWDYKKILSLLSPLLAWSAFWDACVTGAQKEYWKLLNDAPDAYLLHPIIPSEYGLFFCETSRQDPRLNLRTFVGNAQLRPKQRELQRILLKAYKGFETLPLSIHPWSIRWNVWRTDVYMFILAERLSRDENLIKEVIFEGLNSKQIALLEQVWFLRSKVDINHDPFLLDPIKAYDQILKMFQKSERQEQG